MVDVMGYLSTKGPWRQMAGEAVGFCPACNATHERSLSVNLTDGRWVCNRKNHCGQSGGFKALQELYGDKIMPEPKLLDLPKREYQDPTHKAKGLKADGKKFLAGRGLSEIIVAAWRVGQETAYYRKADGEADGIVWPVYDDAGKLVNLKGRCLSVKDFNNKKGCPKWPVGLHLVDAGRNGKRLIITEGELDAMSGHQYGLRNIVSLPNGAGDQTWIELAWDWLQLFDEIVFAIDADAAGRDAQDKIIRRLGYKWALKVATLPGGHKDLNECLMAGVGADAIKAAIANAVEVKPETVHSADWYTDQSWELLANRAGLSGITSGISELDKMTHGWREAEVTIWTGQSGSGKSTVLGQMMLNAIQSGAKACVSSMEIPPAKYLTWLTLQATGAPQPTREQHRMAALWIGTGMAMVDRVGRVELSDLLSDWSYCAQRFGCTIFVADPVQCIASGSDEYKEQKDVITAMIGFAREHRCHVHLVAHPKKLESDGSEIGQNAIKGNKAMTDLAHNIIAIVRGENTTGIHLIKNREYGVVGKAMVMVDRDCKQVFASSGPPDFWPWIESANDDIPAFDSPPEMWAPKPGHYPTTTLPKTGQHWSDV